jgi:hypothetical protein
LPSRPFTFLVSTAMIRSLELDLDVDVSWEVQAHQRINGLWSRVDDVNETLVGTHLKVLTAVLVLVWRANDRHDVLLGGQWHWSYYLCTGAGDCVDDFARRGVDDLVVIRLQSNADLVSRHVDSLPFSWVISRPHSFGSQFPLRKSQILLTAVMLMHCSSVNALFLGLDPTP